MSAPDSIDVADASRVITRALAEDLGAAGDVTTQALVPEQLTARAVLVARSEGILAGAPVVELLYRLLETSIEWTWQVGEGGRFGPGDVLGEGMGSAASLLSGERIALNLLQRLSGVATLTGRYADAVRGTGVIVLDTRKTTPGLRSLERYAVRMGGGCNHRMGLYDRILIKDNHLAVFGRPAEAVRAARRRFPALPVEVEVTDLEGLINACEADPDWILLDNMSPPELKACVEACRRRPSPRPRLEASGGITLEMIREVAKTGVDAISIGALTHSARWIDIAMEMEL